MKMKRLLVLLALPIVLSTCEKETGPYVQIKSIENLIYLSIKAYRIDNGLDGPFVHQLLMVNEAQIYSYKMANGVEEVGTQGLTEHWNALKEMYSFYNEHAVVLKTDSNDEDEILNQLLQSPETIEHLRADVTQCGVGVEADTAGFHYVTVLLMKAD